MAEPINRVTVWQALSEEEQNGIRAAFRPLGVISPEEMVTSASGIAILIGHLKTPELRNVGYRLIALSEGLAGHEADPVKLHFYFHGVGKFFYRFRDVDDFALPKAIEAFERQTRLSAVVAPQLAQSLGGNVPGHAGFDQLRIIHEKAGNYLEAIKVCEAAQTDGWAGDWEKHIKRLTGKIIKSE